MQRFPNELQKEKLLRSRKASKKNYLKQLQANNMFTNDVDPNYTNKRRNLPFTWKPRTFSWGTKMMLQRRKHFQGGEDQKEKYYHGIDRWQKFKDLENKNGRENNYTDTLSDKLRTLNMKRGET